MRVALALGGASCLRADADGYVGPVHGVVACNDAGAEWSGELDAWVSLHPQFFTVKRWVERRAEAGLPAAERLIGHLEADKATQRSRHPVGLEFTDYRFPGQARSGSSGLFAAKVALVDLGFDRVVLCGVPMDRRPHFFDREDWKAAHGFRDAWLSVPQEYRDRMRSMSGWTRTLLGAPEIERMDHAQSDQHD